MEPDFTGFVTRSGVKCADGRTIMAHAFKTSHEQTVPLVWQHQHDDPANVLGHVVLHSSEEGVRGDGFFNDTPSGKQAKALVIHKDITNLSIYANQLVQQAMNVVHGVIREVSLVLSGANPGAFIDNINLAHGDGLVVDDEAIIYNDDVIELKHAAPAKQLPASAVKPDLASIPAPQEPEPAVSHAADLAAAVSDAKTAAPTVQDIINSMNEEQRNVLYALVGAAVEQSATTGDGDAAVSHDDQTDNNDDKEGDQVTGNVFDQTKRGEGGSGATLTHAQLGEIFASAKKSGSLRDAVQEFALQNGMDPQDFIKHSITNIDYMFPDARNVTDTPDWVGRRQEWVNGVLTGTRHTPFSRIKSMTADITLDEARARGYVKGAVKREEFFAVARRTTTPQTIYKKQKLDRDDILDITDFDVVAWLKAEMRLMLDEELARAILIGDGRDVADADKIVETNIRPIVSDADLYVSYVNIDDSLLPPTASQTYEYIVDQVATSLQWYMGSGLPTMYCARSWLTKMLLTKDTLGRRLHSTSTELAAAMGVDRIVPVDAMETLATSIIAVIVNLSDYTVGSDRGGEVNFFDDFDLDLNKYTYLYETRVSGALTKFKSAIVLKLFTGAGGLLSDPTVPTFVKTTGVVTIPTMANVTYVSVNDTTGVESGALSAGAQSAIAAGASVHIRAKAAATYTFANNAACNWTFQRPAS